MHDATGQLAPQAWELGAAAAAGLTLSQFRFTLAFFLSVAAGALLRFIPTARGRRRSCCAAACRLLAVRHCALPACAGPVRRPLTRVAHQALTCCTDPVCCPQSATCSPPCPAS